MCVKYDNFEDNGIIVYLNKFCYWKKIVYVNIYLSVIIL